MLVGPKPPTYIKTTSTQIGQILQGKPTQQSGNFYLGKFVDLTPFDPLPDLPCLTPPFFRAILFFLLHIRHLNKLSLLLYIKKVTISIKTNNKNLKHRNFSNTKIMGSPTIICISC